MLAGLVNAGLATFTGGAGFGFIDKLRGEAGLRADGQDGVRAAHERRVPQSITC